MYSNSSNNNSNSPTVRRSLPTFLGLPNSSTGSVVTGKFCLQSSLWKFLRNVGFIIVIVFVWTRTGSQQEDVNDSYSLPTTTTQKKQTGSLQQDGNIQHINNQSHPPLTTTSTLNPPQKKKLSLRLLGERHSGTNWMTGHLEVRLLVRLVKDHLPDCHAALLTCFTSFFFGL
jgi:hypothetical protein